MKALVVVDMQNDFCASNGALYNPNVIEIVPNILTLIKTALNNGDKIIYTHDTHEENYLNTQEGKNLPIQHCLFGTDGWRIIPQLEWRTSANNNILHINKDTFCYDDWGGIVGLNEVEEIIVCGTITSICVISNIIGLKTNFPEIPITVYANCCADINEENQEAALKVMEAIQVKVIR